MGIIINWQKGLLFIDTETDSYDRTQTYLYMWRRLSVAITDNRTTWPISKIPISNDTTINRFPCSGGQFVFECLFCHFACGHVFHLKMTGWAQNGLSIASQQFRQPLKRPPKRMLSISIYIYNYIDMVWPNWCLAQPFIWKHKQLTIDMIINGNGTVSAGHHKVQEDTSWRWPLPNAFTKCT